MLIHHAQVVLRSRMPLLSGFAIPLHSLAIIFHDPPAKIIHPPQAVLRSRMPLLGGFAIPLHSLAIALVLIILLCKAVLLLTVAW